MIMKKLLYVLLTAAAGLTLASCVQDLDPVSDPALGGSPMSVTFSVDVRGALTKADTPESSVLDDGSGVFRLYAAAFGSDGTLVSTSRIGGEGFEPTATLSDGKADVSMILNKKQNYKVVFFAEKDDDAYDVKFANGNVATFAFKSGLNANDSKLDAFYAVQEVTGATTSYSVTLKRPFAQVNVLVPNDNAPSGKTSFRSTMTVKAPTSFNLFTGAAGTELAEITFAENGISTTAFGKYKDTHKWIGMNFVLVPAGGKVQVLSFNETDLTQAVAIGEIPVKVNGRTNLVGELYGKETEYTFNLNTDEKFGDETDNPLGGGEQGGEGGEGGEGGGEQGGDEPEDTEIEMVGGGTYTEAQPFTIDASNPSAPKTLTLSVNGHTFSDVNAGADNNAKVTAVSSDDKVATAAVVGNDVVITPVGNGKAKITVTTPAYTKTDYAASSFEFWVEVTGMNGGGQTTITSDTIIFADLNLENGTQYKDPFTEGNMSVQFGSGTNDGKYYTTGAGMRIYGDGWVTVSSSKTINKIEYTFDPTEQKDGDAIKTFFPDEATFGSVDSGSYDKSTQTWTGSAKSVKLTRATGTGHWRLQKIKVYYADGQGGGDSETPTTATLDVSPASLNLTVGGTATITASTNSTAKPTFVSSNTSVADVDANGLVTAKAAGSATITVAVAAVEGAFTAASKTVPVTVAAAGGGGGTGNDTMVTLTNAEILPATVDAEITGSNPSYRDATITSASGTWTANMAKHKDGLKYLQLRNKKGAYITSPLFTSAVSKVVVTLTSEDVDLLDRTLHAVPPATTLPTGQDASGKDIVYAATEWANEYGCVRTGADKGAEVTIDFAEGSNIKQFMLIVEGGATYIDHIDVYY